MTLHAILSWYNESPTWLAGCVASLTRIGVDHVIALDGRYPHFDTGAPANSRPEQIDAITSTAMGAGMAVTLHRPTTPLLEPVKRTLGFRLLNAVGEYGDWALVIDADEIVSAGNHGLKNELALVDDDTHVVACRVTNSIDPYADPLEPDNDLTDKTLELHHKMPISEQFGSLQSRLWRVLHDMRVETNHYTYTGADEHGVRWNLRPDIGKPVEGLPPSPIAKLQQFLTIEHRKNHRTRARRETKAVYYDTRDRLGLER